MTFLSATKVVVDSWHGRIDLNFGASDFRLLSQRQRQIETKQTCREAPMRRHICALLLLLFQMSPASAGEMSFQVRAPGEMDKLLMNDYGWRIFSSGQIDDRAGQRLREIILKNNIPDGSRLYLHSAGGSLFGGIALGRVIREYRLHTLIGQRDTSLRDTGSKPGYCYSACAAAFLGGEFRFWTQGSTYGVHRFFWDFQTPNDAAMAQIVSATLVEYIRSMGVDTKIFFLASQAGPTEFITPPLEVLLALNVVNNGQKSPKWTIESIPQGIYLKGEQETYNGLNKFMLLCSPSDSKILLYAIFDGGSNAERDTGWSVNWLFLGDSKINLDRHLVSKQIHNGMINLMYRTDAQIIAAISRATVVGVGLQPTAAAQIFLGFSNMPFGEGSKKLPGFIAVCRRGLR